MPQSYSPASMDLGLGGDDGDALSQQVDDEETKRKKKLLQMGGDRSNDPSAGANMLGGAAMSLLGSFRG